MGMAKKKVVVKKKASAKKKNDAMLKRAAILLAVILALAMLAGPVLGSCTRQTPIVPSDNVSTPASTGSSGNTTASP